MFICSCVREARRVRAARGRGHAGGDLARRGGALRGRGARLRLHTAPVAVQVTPLFIRTRHKHHLRQIL